MQQYNEIYLWCEHPENKETLSAKVASSSSLAVIAISLRRRRLSFRSARQYLKTTISEIGPLLLGKSSVAEIVVSLFSESEEKFSAPPWLAGLATKEFWCAWLSYFKCIFSESDNNKVGYKKLSTKTKLKGQKNGIGKNDKENNHDDERAPATNIEENAGNENIIWDQSLLNGDIHNRKHLSPNEKFWKHS